MGKMNAHQQDTYDAVFGPPIAGDLAWRDVRSMLVAMSDVVVEQNDSFKVSRNGKTLLLQLAAHKVLDDMQEMNQIRQFLR